MCVVYATTNTHCFTPAFSYSSAVILMIFFSSVQYYSGVFFSIILHFLFSFSQFHNPSASLFALAPYF